MFEYFLMFVALCVFGRLQRGGRTMSAGAEQPISALVVHAVSNE